jgi:hypothetical protein
VPTATNYLPFSLVKSLVHRRSHLHNTMDFIFYALKGTLDVESTITHSTVCTQELSKAFGSDDLATAVNLTARLRYVTRIRDAIQEKANRFDDAL